MKKNIILICLLSILLSGCLPTAFQKGDKNTSKKDEEFVQGELVAGFPSFPKYPKAIVVESVSSGEGKGAVFTTSDDMDKVLTFLNDSLPTLGWEYQLIKNSDTSYEYKVKDVTYEGTIIVNIAADGKTTALTYSANSR